MKLTCRLEYMTRITRCVSRWHVAVSKVIGHRMDSMLYCYW